MLKFVKKSKLIFGVLFIIIAMPFLVWGLTEYTNYHTLFSENAHTWIGFFGSYTGAIAGGYITVLVMDETIKNGDANLEKSINENKILQQRNERVEFCNELASIIADFCSESKNNFYFSLLSLQSKDNLKEQENSLKFYQDLLLSSQIPLSLADSTTSQDEIQKMERNVKQNEIHVSECQFFYNVTKSDVDSNLNKIYSSNINSLYFLLKVKLKKIEKAKNLLEKIDQIYKLSNPNVDDFASKKVELDSLTTKLLNETTEFIDSYTDVQLENDNK